MILILLLTLMLQIFNKVNGQKRARSTDRTKKQMRIWKENSRFEKLPTINPTLTFAVKMYLLKSFSLSVRDRAEDLLSECTKVASKAELRDQQLHAAGKLSGPFWTATQALRENLRELQDGLQLAEPPACESPTLADQMENNERVGEEMERALAEASWEIPFLFLYR